jgi:hypothetical protein
MQPQKNARAWHLNVAHQSAHPLYARFVGAFSGSRFAAARSCRACRRFKNRRSLHDMWT